MMMKGDPYQMEMEPDILMDLVVEVKNT